ncbi:MAG: hypothetical protein IJY65_04950 [Clostridia bacterium]|nr:hypothetical protein [Clostridia bacterium]
MQKPCIFEKRAYRESGVCIATLAVCLPLTETKIDDFYKKLAARYSLELERRLLPLARAEFLASTDEKKRFTFKPYNFSTDFTLTREGGRIVASITERLTRRGRLLAETVKTDVFDESSGLLVKEKKKKRKKHL